MKEWSNEGILSSWYKWIGILLIFIGTGLGIGGAQKAAAADITDSVTGISGTDAQYQGEPVNSSDVANWSKDGSYQLVYHYTIKQGAKVQEGDTAKVDLPNGATFPDNIASTNLLDANGKSVGTFSAKKGDSFGTITFTSYYSHYILDRKGDITVYVQGSKSGSGPSSDTYIGKNGWGFAGNWFDGTAYGLDSNGRYQYVEWDILANPK